GADKNPYTIFSQTTFVREFCAERVNNEKERQQNARQDLNKIPSSQNCRKNDLHESLQRERAALYLRLKNGALKGTIEKMCEFLAVNRCRQLSASDCGLQAVDD